MKLTTPINWEPPVPEGTYRFQITAAGEKANAAKDGRNVWVEARIIEEAPPYAGRAVVTWYPIECRSRHACIRAEEQLVSLSRACGLPPPVRDTDAWLGKVVKGRVVRKESDGRYPERNEVTEWFPSGDDASDEGDF